jgi:hypothetical protein
MGDALGSGARIIWVVDDMRDRGLDHDCQHRYQRRGYKASCPDRDALDDLRQIDPRLMRSFPRTIDRWCFNT